MSKSSQQEHHRGDAHRQAVRVLAGVGEGHQVTTLQQGLGPRLKLASADFAQTELDRQHKK